MFMILVMMDHNVENWHAGHATALQGDEGAGHGQGHPGHRQENLLKLMWPECKGLVPFCNGKG